MLCSSYGRLIPNLFPCYHMAYRSRSASGHSPYSFVEIYNLRVFTVRPFPLLHCGKSNLSLPYYSYLPFLQSNGNCRGKIIFAHSLQALIDLCSCIKWTDYFLSVRSCLTKKKVEFLHHTFGTLSFRKSSNVFQGTWTWHRYIHWYDFQNTAQ